VEKGYKEKNLDTCDRFNISLIRGGRRGKKNGHLHLGRVWDFIKRFRGARIPGESQELRGYQQREVEGFRKQRTAVKNDHHAS